MENIQPISQPTQTPSKNPYKILFFLSLGLFLIVSSVLITLLLTKKTLISNQQPTPTIQNKITPTVSEVIPTIPAIISSTPKLSPEKTVQTFYQDYIKTSPLSYENSPYLTLNLIKSLDETKSKITSSDPVLNSSIIPDCGITTNEAVIKNNSATVTVFLCHKSEGKQYLSINLVLENSQWKINKISLP